MCRKKKKKNASRMSVKTKLFAPAQEGPGALAQRWHPKSDVRGAPGTRDSGPWASTWLFNSSMRSSESPTQRPRDPETRDPSLAMPGPCLLGPVSGTFFLSWFWIPLQSSGLLGFMTTFPMELAKKHNMRQPTSAWAARFCRVAITKPGSPKIITPPYIRRFPYQSLGSAMPEIPLSIFGLCYALGLQCFRGGEKNTLLKSPN